MSIAVIVAMGENRAIGKNNSLLWHLPDDLQHFKKLTLGKTVIMGRKTHESIGRPLPGRRNIILSHRSDFQAEGCLIVHSVTEALDAVSPADDIFIIGGEAIFAAFMPLTTRIFLTEVNDTLPGDTFFPVLNHAEWKETDRILHAADDRHAVSFSFVTLDRAQ